MQRFIYVSWCLFAVAALLGLGLLSGAAWASVGTLADSSGEVVAWGNNYYGQTLVPDGTFAAVAAGDHHSLGIYADGTLAGWGDSSWGQINVPTGPFTAIAGGYVHSVGVRQDGTLAGWGTGGGATVPAGVFTAVSAGEYCSLGLHPDGTVIGWGDNSYGQLNVPGGSFVAIDAGHRHALALRADGTLAGWGANDSGQATVPTGTFTAISTGVAHSLGIRDDGSLAGWGWNGWGQTNVPVGEFLAVAGGEAHSIAIRSDGTLAGWGGNFDGQTNVPAGTFISVSAGRGHNLALRARTEYDGDLLVSYTGAPYGPNGLKANLNRSITVAGNARIESPLYFYNNPVMNVAGNVTFAGSGSTVGTGTIAAAGGLEIVSGTLLLVPPELTLSAAGPLIGGGELDLTGGDLTVGLTGTSAFTGPILISADSSLTFTGTGFTTPTSLDVYAGGSLRLTAGQRLQVDSYGQNFGRIELLGNGHVAGGTAEIEFGGYAYNDPFTGLITGRDAVLRFDAWLTNEGSLALTGGTNDVFGDIDNQPSGKIIVTGGATATFYDDVTQNGALTVSEVGSTNSVAVFLGNVYGSGASGGGDIFYEGEIHPGSSPALVTYVNDVTFGSGATLAIELGGATRGTEYDALDITGALSLGGTLDVVPIDLGGGLFQPGEGEVFEILTATGGITGDFALMNLPELTGDLYWDVLRDVDSFSLQVLAPGLLGDYNQNGVVDAADYTVWRDNYSGPGVPGNPVADGDGDGDVDEDDYIMWKSHFGETSPGSGATGGLSAAPVPEPATLWLALLGVTCGLVQRFARRASKHGRLKIAGLVAFLLLGLLHPRAVYADTFGSGENTFTIDFVDIGNAGNGDDAGAGGGLYSSPYGGVDYAYRLGVTEVPQDWITKATNLGMTNVTAGAWTGSWPAAYMTWYECTAFVNWLNTNTGHQPAYNLTYSGGWSMNLWSSEEAWQLGGQNLYRNKDTYYFLPSEDEWYKAAYHQNDGVTANYWDYATGSNVPPTPGGGTAAGRAWYNGIDAFPTSVENVGGASSYGTRGQNGNVWEWNESALDGSNDSPTEVRGLRGGAWGNTEFYLRSSYRGTAFQPQYDDNYYGFRVASVPEPLPGDFNCDGSVDAADYTVWRDTLGSTTDLRANGDNTGASAGVIDEADYAVWKSHFGETAPGSGATGGLSASAPVPEPATLWLALLGVTCGLVQRFARRASRDGRLKIAGLVAFLLLGLLHPRAVYADTFGSGENTFTIGFVTVGDPGNPDDSGTTGNWWSPYGGVGDTFRVGTYEISRDVILKANAEGNLAITMFSYADAGISGGDRAARPASGVTWNEAARFVNWLNVSSGHSLAYKFTLQPDDPGYSPDANIELWQEGDAGYDPNNLYRNSDAFYFLPSEDEWYKAAYYSGSSSTYFDYATQQDFPDEPSATSGGTASGTAVFWRNYFTGPADIDYAGGLSHYGTMAQNGNVWEWMESASDGSNNTSTEARTIRGAHWSQGVEYLRSNFRLTAAGPTWQDDEWGFRVASVPIFPLGDYNQNGVVDAADYTLWRDNYSGPGVPGNPVADGDGDGDVDEADYVVWKSHFGETSPASGATGGLSASAPVPEPASLLLMAIAATGWLAVCRPRRVRAD